jgi:hypothetical protein
MPVWRERLTSGVRRRDRRRDAALYADLRSAVLAIDPTTLDLAPGEPWDRAAVALMELGLDEGSATVVAVADGTVSLYLSSGGGVIGAGAHAAVAAPARRFRELIATARGQLRAVEAFPGPPGSGQVGFHALIGDARYTASAPESALRSARHPLAELYAAGQDVLTEIRLASETTDA